MALPVNSYKNIIFDLGGVLININYSLTSLAFEGLGVTNFDTLFSKASQTQLFDLYEKGLISSGEFRKQMKAFLPDSVNNTMIDAAWNAMLLDFPKERLDFLQQTKQTHRTFLLSNTNDIHIRKINEQLMQQYGIQNLNGFFEKVYLSYEVNKRKPDVEIFEQVLSENNLNPSETLFIDDSPQHIEGAKKLGIQTYWLDVNKETILKPLVPIFV